MPNWRRIIVGDAFKLPDWRDSVDVGLILPTLISVVLIFSSARWPMSHWDFRHLWLGIACLLLCLLLAREKAWILIGALGYVAVRLPIGLFSANSKLEMLGLAALELVLVGALLLLVLHVRLPRSGTRDEITVFGLLISIAVFAGFLYALFHLT